MNILTEKAIAHSKTGVFSLPDVLVWLGESRNSVRNIVKRAVARGEIVHLRRGLYCLPEKYNRNGISRNMLANMIYGPSYVSMEAALAYHGWIPEAVHTVTSVSMPRAKAFENSVGRFEYVQVKQSPFLSGVRRVALDESAASFLVAGPLKALCDLVAFRGEVWTGVEPLVESMRIDEDDLLSLKRADFTELDGVYRSLKVRRFLDGLRKDLGK